MCENCAKLEYKIKDLEANSKIFRKALLEERNIVQQISLSNSRLLKQIDQGVRHIANLEEELRMYKNKPKPKLSEVIREWTR